MGCRMISSVVLQKGDVKVEVVLFECEIAAVGRPSDLSGIRFAIGADDQDPDISRNVKSVASGAAR